MRHRKARRKLGRTGAHRRAMVSNMLMALVEHGSIVTTERKAKDLRSAADRLVSRATSLGELLTKDPDEMTPEERARLVHAIRMARRTLRNKDSVLKLFSEIAPRYVDRRGGYTRVVKKGFRRGDGAPMAVIEFVEGAALPGEEESSSEGGEERRRGPLGWLRRRIGSKGAEEAEE